MRAPLCLAGLVAAALVAPTGAAGQTPSPDLGAMALRPSDFPYGAKVTRVADSGASGYEQQLRVGDRASGRPVLAFADQFLAALDSADAARADLADAKRHFRSRRGRAGLVRLFAKNSGISAKKVRIRGFRSVAAGDSAFELRLTVRSRHIAFDEEFMSVGRVETVFLVGGRTPSRLQRRRVSILRKAAARIRAGLAPRSTAPPVISGTPSTGQTLSASTGGWDPAMPPSGYAYQWERCDAAGGACAGIPGATGSSYVVAAGDAGATLRVQVMAANAYGGAAAESGQTGVVT